LSADVESENINNHNSLSYGGSLRQRTDESRRTSSVGLYTQGKGETMLYINNNKIILSIYLQRVQLLNDASREPRNSCVGYYENQYQKLGGITSPIITTFIWHCQYAKVIHMAGYQSRKANKSSSGAYRPFHNIHISISPYNTDKLTQDIHNTFSTNQITQEMF